MEIGSVYEIDPKYMEEISLDRNTELTLKEVTKYGKQNIFFTASGREAISLALQSIVEENPDVCKKCLMPTYMCDCVFWPFALNEWELCFYHIGKDMKADEEELRRLLEEEKPGMIFIHAYYGMDTWKELRPFLKQYQKQGLLVMEDVTQSYYLQADYLADYIVGSLRKWYAVADGGFVASDLNIDIKIAEVDDFISRGRLQMQIKKWNYLHAMQNEPEELQQKSLQSEKDEFLSLNRRMEEYLDETEKVALLSGFSRNMLIMMDEEACKQRRNKNYRILYEGLQNKKCLSLVMKDEEFLTVPLYLPVYVEERDELQKFLAQRGIYVPVLWPVGKENEDCLSDDEQYIFSHIAAIPMDQRYGREEMERIIKVIEEYGESYK